MSIKEEEIGEIWLILATSTLRFPVQWSGFELTMIIISPHARYLYQLCGWPPIGRPLLLSSQWGGNGKKWPLSIFEKRALILVRLMFTWFFFSSLHFNMATQNLWQHKIHLLPNLWYFISRIMFLLKICQNALVTLLLLHSADDRGSF